MVNRPWEHPGGPVRRGRGRDVLQELRYVSAHGLAWAKPGRGALGAPVSQACVLAGPLAGETLKGDPGAPPPPQVSANSVEWGAGALWGPGVYGAISAGGTHNAAGRGWCWGLGGFTGGLPSTGGGEAQERVHVPWGGKGCLHRRPSHGVQPPLAPLPGPGPVSLFPPETDRSPETHGPPAEPLPPALRAPMAVLLTRWVGDSP